MTTSIIANDPKQRRQVLTGTLVGTTIEFYDFLIYAQAAAIVLAPHFIEPAAQSNPQVAQVLAWATLGISFLFRPLGAIVAGHIGDRYGRKMILVFTLIGMGAATFCIGLYRPMNQSASPHLSCWFSSVFSRVFPLAVNGAVQP